MWLFMQAQGPEVAGGAVAGIGFVLCIGVFALISLLATIFWVWMLIDCLTKEPSEGNDKLIWGLVIFLGSLPGALIYYFFRRGDRIKKYGE